MNTLVISGLALGLASNLHCLGMCGPLAIALPVHQLNGTGKFFAVLLYNAGRILTYSLLGGILGIVGAGFELIGLQQVLSIVAGIFILLSLIWPTLVHSKVSKLGWLVKIHAFIKSMFSRLLGKRTSLSFGLMGILNGFLPCGMIYMALAGALVFGNPYQSSGFMLFFGLGTLPVMVLVPMFKSLIQAKFPFTLKRIVPALATVSAILLILRGLNLGIPYISPEFAKSQDKTVAVSCHSEHNCCKKK